MDMAGFPFIYKVDKTNKFYIKDKVGHSSANDYPHQNNKPI